MNHFEIDKQVAKHIFENSSESQEQKERIFLKTMNMSILKKKN